MPLALSRTGSSSRSATSIMRAISTGSPANVSKVLLTWGLRGCVIYSVDPETQQTLAGLGLPMLSAPSAT
jgi:DUF2075 family protein